MPSLQFPSIAAIPFYWATQAPQRIALQSAETALSYQGLASRIQATLAWLDDFGLQRGDCLAFVGRNCIEALVLFYAGAARGLRLVYPNWRLAGPEMATVLRDAAPGLVILDTNCTDTFGQWVEHEGLAQAQVADLPAASPGFALDPETQAQVTHPCAGDLLLCYTSGSTGRPKGVRLTQDNWLAVQEQVMQWPGGGWREGSVALCSLPFFHVAGLRLAFLALAFGGTAVITARNDAPHLRDWIQRYGVTKVNLVPTLLQALLDDTEDDQALASLDTIYYGGAPIPGDLIARSRERLRCRLVQTYGATETAGSAATLDDADHFLQDYAATRCGKALPSMQLQIRDPQGRPLPNDEVGEVWIYGPTVAAGYWNLPEESQRTFINGWFRTGDLGALNAAGYLQLQGRLSELIKSGGEKVFPIEVERALAAHPAVADVAVYGQPDPQWGETVAAVVVLHPQSQASASDLMLFCRERIAGFKLPRQIRFVAHIPRNAGGKIIRAELGRL